MSISAAVLIASPFLLSGGAGAASACPFDMVMFFPDPEGPGVSYSVEIADDPDEQARGLMFRTEMAPDAGMIFIYESPRVARFWMKNTILSLDMVFVGDDGVVVNVAENTTPFSENTWSSDAPVRAVVELNAGQAAEHGIGPGTEAAHPSFEAADGPHACPRG